MSKKLLYVFLRLPGDMASGKIALVGELLHQRLANGMKKSYFQYHPDWLSAKYAFPLDPIHLPLQKKFFTKESISGLWPVFEDALPDAWGRRLLYLRSGMDVSKENSFELMETVKWAEPGALGFSPDPDPPPFLPEMTIDKVFKMAKDTRGLEQLRINNEIPEKYKNILESLSASSNIGGARPKALARMKEQIVPWGSESSDCKGNEHPNKPSYWIVKFPSVHDHSLETIILLEYFGLMCARKSGIITPDFFLKEQNRSLSPLLLCIKRFDMTENFQNRRHFLSFLSLTDMEEQLGMPYSKMANVIKMVSKIPKQDLEMLYKQMALNIFLGNCDDHLKNFAMLYNPEHHGFCLSPAYDIVPNLWQNEHILSAGGKTSEIELYDLIVEGREFGFTKNKCYGLLDEITAGIEAGINYLTSKKNPYSKHVNNMLSIKICQQLITKINKKVKYSGWKYNR